MPWSAFLRSQNRFVIASPRGGHSLYHHAIKEEAVLLCYKMGRLRQRPRYIRREPPEDQFGKYVNDLIGHKVTSPAPSPLAEIVFETDISPYVDPSPGFSFPTSSPSGYVRNTSRLSIQQIPTFGWIMIISSAVLGSIAVLLGLNIIFTSQSHKRHYVGADEAVPGMIVVSRRAPPEAYGRLEDEEDPSKSVGLTDDVPKAILFRTRKQQRGFERLESERWRAHSHLMTIPEDRSLGDLGTLCDEDYIFEDRTE